MSSSVMSENRTSTSYQAPAFVDAERAERVLATRKIVEPLYRDYMKKKHIPGLVYAVVLDGEIIYSGEFGYTNLESKTLASSKSLFRIASMSKNFTAMAILQLRDAGKLSLDDQARKYLPEMNSFNYPTSDSPIITIRHLLTHGAGLPEDNPWGDRQLARSDKSLMQLVGNGLSFSNVPGNEYEYSNLGYALLGQIIQRVSGMTFEKYTTEKILKPLGMNETVWEYEKAKSNQLAQGYQWLDGAHVDIPLQHHGSFGAMGGLITSIEDFSKFVKFHLSAWPARSEKEPIILRRSSVREMHYPWRVTRFSSQGKCPYMLAYSYGLNWAQECDDNPYLSHSGGLPGFGSNWIVSPELGLSIISFDNKTYASTLWVNRSVFKKVIESAGLIPRQERASNILKERQKRLTNILTDWRNAENEILFADNFFKDNRLKDLVKLSEETFKQAGKIIKVGELIPINQLRGEYVLYGENKDIKVFFTLTPETTPLIQELEINLVDKVE